MTWLELQVASDRALGLAGTTYGLTSRSSRCIIAIDFRRCCEFEPRGKKAGTAPSERGLPLSFLDSSHRNFLRKYLFGRQSLGATARIDGLISRGRTRCWSPSSGPEEFLTS